MVVETANYVPFEIFGTKTVLLKLNCKLLRTLSWKNRAFSQKVFFRVFTTEFRASREMFWGKKDLSFEKVLFFCYHFWSLSDFFVFCAKFFSQVCQTTDQRAERNKMGKLTWKTCFFNQFWTLRKKKLGFSAKQWGMILKIVAYLGSWPISEIFLEAKIFVWKFSVLERKHRNSSEKVFSGFSKAHLKCPVQHFEKRMMNVNFTFCALFRTLCVFFWSGRKISQEFQNHELSVKSKILGRIFLRQMLFQNIFSFWAEKLGVSAKNYRLGCQNCKLRTFRNFWRKNSFFLNWIANFFGLWDEKKRAFSQKVFFRVFTTGFRASWEMFWGKMMSILKKF